jgi:replication factor A1
MEMKTEAYINKIIEDTGLTKKEIQNLVNEKKTELKGLISDEGALFVIAKELGVDVKSENKDILTDIELNISDITPNMKNLSLVGRIKEIYKISSFTGKDGETGYVGSFLLHDNTGDIRIVLWNEDVNIFKDSNFEKNELVKILNGYVKQSKYRGLEIHIGRLGKIILSPEDIDYHKYPKILNEFTQIKDISLSSSSISLEAKILQKYPIKEFSKKDGGKGKVGSIIVIDSTGSIRVTFWNDNTEMLNEINVGDYISILNVYPRENRLNTSKIDLHSNRNTKIVKKDENLNLNADVVKNVKLLQKKENLVSFKGIISSIDDIKTVTLKSGEEISLLNFEVNDETDGIRITLWREKAIKYSKMLKVGTGVLLKNVLIRYNDFSGRKEASSINDSTIEIIDLKIPKFKKIERSTIQDSKGFSRNYTLISDINSSGFVEIKGFIAKEINRIFFYEACSKCLRKVDNCSCEKKGETNHRMILGLMIDDETGVIRASFIGESAEKLISAKASNIVKIKDTPDYKKLIEKISENLIGKDLILKGRAKYSEFSNSYELNVSDFQFLDINEELEREINEIEI